MEHSEFSYVDFGERSVSKRRILHVNEVRAAVEKAKSYNCFRTWYRFPEDVKKADTVARFAGPVVADWIPWDFDNEKDPGAALRDARAFVESLGAEFELSPDDLRYFFSGKKGFHVVAPAALFGGFEPSPQLPGVLKGLALELAGKLKVDPAIYDKQRFIRIANTKHDKSGLYRIPLEPGEFLHATLEEIQEWAKSPREIESQDQELSPVPGLVELYQKHLAGRGTQKKEPGQPSKAELFESGMKEGDGRDVRAYSICCYLRDHKIPQDAALQILRGWDGGNVDPLERTDGPGILEKKIQNAYRDTQEEAPPRFKRIVSIGEILAEDYKRPAGLLARSGDPPILATHQILLIGANRGGGKTVSCLNVGMCLACGLKAFGIWGPEKPIRVFYVHSEAEHPYFVQEQLNKMFSDPGRITEEQQQLIKENFNMAISADLLNGDILDIKEAAHQALLSQAVADTGAQLLILDPLYWITGGADVERAQDMQGIGKALRAVAGLAECAVLATTHFNKSGHIAGSYAFEGFVSSILELQDISRLDGFSHYDVGLYVTKARNGWPRDGQIAWSVALDPNTLWYDKTTKDIPDLEELRAERAGRRKEYTTKMVVDILSEHGAMSYTDVVDMMMNMWGCSESTAKRVIRDAKKQAGIQDKGRMLTLENTN